MYRKSFFLARNGYFGDGRVKYAAQFVYHSAGYYRTRGLVSYRAVAEITVHFRVFAGHGYFVGDGIAIGHAFDFRFLHGADPEIDFYVGNKYSRVVFGNRYVAGNGFRFGVQYAVAFYAFVAYFRPERMGKTLIYELVVVGDCGYP